MHVDVATNSIVQLEKAYTMHYHMSCMVAQMVDGIDDGYCRWHSTLKRRINLSGHKVVPGRGKEKENAWELFYHTTRLLMTKASICYVTIMVSACFFVLCFEFLFCTFGERIEGVRVTRHTQTIIKSADIIDVILFTYCLYCSLKLHALVRYVQHFLQCV